ncbi:DUF1638 domain-containing protein [Deferrisoma palaeochoriense]
MIPRVDDCIALFLGSAGAYRRLREEDLGTYFVTRGWIEAGLGPFEEARRWAERWGDERAEGLVRTMLRHYRRLVFVATPGADLSPHREKAREWAARYGLTYGEVRGDPGLLRRLVRGPWGEEFLVVEPGGEVRLEDLLTPSARHGPAG